MVTCPTINQSDSSFFGLLTVSLQEQNKIVSQTKLHSVDVSFFGLLMYSIWLTLVLPMFGFIFFMLFFN